MSEETTELPRGVGVFLCDPTTSGIWVSKRKPRGSVYDGYDQTPGGEVDAGETDVEAMIRELREETGIEAKASDFIPLGESQLYTKPDGTEYVSTQYLMRTLIWPQNMEPEKQEDWRFVHFDNLSECILYQSVIDAIPLAHLQHLKSKCYAQI